MRKTRRVLSKMRPLAFYDWQVKQVQQAQRLPAMTQAVNLRTTLLQLLFMCSRHLNKPQRDEKDLLQQLLSLPVSRVFTDWKNYPKESELKFLSVEMWLQHATSAWVQHLKPMANGHVNCPITLRWPSGEGPSRLLQTAHARRSKMGSSVINGCVWNAGYLCSWITFI